MTNTSISTPVINAAIDRAVVFVVLNPLVLLDTLDLFYCAVSRNVYVRT